ncbi:hypothetical protein PLCT2_03005 [Planctomycetaceae bacterium]|nr:hypothetical protein PLCT2_03005 [Planctomycetaceae bacterium]
MSAASSALIDDHQDVVSSHDRFPSVRFQGVDWDLSHLNPFALRVDIGEGLLVDVVVLFSCHCFTHGAYRDPRVPIPGAERYWDGRDARVLNAERYHLSKQFLPQLIHELTDRHIMVEDASRPTFVTMEVTDSFGKVVHYAVFFEVRKDKRRQKRLLLRVQSAYPIEHLNKRQQKARKVRFVVLLRAAYTGKPIKG